MQSIPVSAKPQRTLRLFTVSVEGCVIFFLWEFADIDTASSAA
jgi:hypothetical protein